METEIHMSETTQGPTHFRLMSKLKA
ncbi:sigma factor-binding protein Crl, partial [Vibrio parahaemolyticus]|nr:sigma factor-binding protein Crl [Vibrio parahaemolyticus]